MHCHATFHQKGGKNKYKNIFSFVYFVWLLGSKCFICCLLLGFVLVLDLDVWVVMALFGRKLIGLVYYIWLNFIKVGDSMQTLDSPSEFPSF